MCTREYVHIMDELCVYLYVYLHIYLYIIVYNKYIHVIITPSCIILHYSSEINNHKARLVETLGGLIKSVVVKYRVTWELGMARWLHEINGLQSI